MVGICWRRSRRGRTDLAPYLIGLAIVGARYGALVATRQRDTRALIAYASLSQLDLLAVGAFIATPDGLEGALIASVSHGLVIAILLLLAGSLALRIGSFGLGTGGLPAATSVPMSLLVI